MMNPQLVGAQPQLVGLGAEEVPWWDKPRTWPLVGRLAYGLTLGVALLGAVHFATKK